MPYFRLGKDEQTGKDGSVVEGKARTTSGMFFSKSTPISWPFLKIIKVFKAGHYLGAQQTIRPTNIKFQFHNISRSI